MTDFKRTRFDLNAVRLLVDVVDNAGYATASRATGIAKSTLSQRIMALEKAVGTPLLRRTTRSFSLTGAGKLLLAHAREIDALAKRVEHDLRELDTKVCGKLRVTCSIAQAQFALGSVIPQFLAEHPGISLEMHATDRFVDLVAEGFDLAVRSHGMPLPDSLLIQRVVGHIPWILVAAPSYLEGKVPELPSDLLNEELFFFGQHAQEPSWRLRSPGNDITMTLRPRLRTEDMRLLRRICLEGAGIVALPAYIVAEAINGGLLRRVLPDWLVGDATISILMPPRGQGSQAGSALGAHLAATLPTILDPGLRIVELKKR